MPVTDPDLHSAVAEAVPPPREHSAVVGLPGFRHQYEGRGTQRLHYVTNATAQLQPAVVLLHGWPFTWTVWRRLMPRLAAAGYAVVAPDLPGTGDSASPTPAQTKTQVADSLHRIMWNLRFDSIALVGMDIGAMVAFAYATTRPESVRRLVLAESALPGVGLDELLTAAPPGFIDFVPSAFPNLETLTADELKGRLSRAIAVRNVHGGLREYEVKEIERRYAAPGALATGLKHYAVLDEDARENQARAGGSTGPPLVMPVLVLNGEDGLPQSVLLEGVRHTAADVTADTVPAAGHLFAADNPDWVAERLLWFFGPETAEKGEPKWTEKERDGMTEG